MLADLQEFSPYLCFSLPVCYNDLTMRKSKNTGYSFFTIINLTAALMAVLYLILLFLLNVYLKRSASDRLYTKFNNTIATNQLQKNVFMTAYL